MTQESTPLGATLTGSGTHFAVWAPKAQQVEVEIEREGRGGPSRTALARSGDGLHAGVIEGVGAGARYRFRLDGEASYPDPYSRFQPEGPHGPSEVIDPAAFSWTDGAWPGLTMDGLVIYELHVGTYTPDGTYAALIEQLPELKRLGVTALEIMPVNEFPGDRNWGYDGVAWFAPTRAYGRPDDLRRLIDEAHRVGLGVLLDVVYNHLGPDGNYLGVYSDDYFTSRHETPWGQAINYDGRNSRWVRRMVTDNIRAWVQEYHVDGFRLDAVDQIIDESDTHILAEIASTARDATPRNIVVIAEDARNEVRLIRPREAGGYGLDAVWADDFNHEVRVFLSNAHENYYANYLGNMEQIARAVTEGFAYQGEQLPTSNRRRGTKVTDEPATAFVFCIQNHDQVGNRPFGERLHHAINQDRYAVASTLLLFAPETPLLFMGQEFAASTPFLFFTDHNPDLGRLVTEGRRQEFQGFQAFADDDLRASIPDPQAEATFLASKVRLDERERHRGTYDLYRALLAMRRDDPVLARQDRSATEAEALGAEAVAIHRWRGRDRRVLIANFGPARQIPFEEIVGLRDHPRARWRVALSTSRRRFGGGGERVSLRGQGAERVVAVPARTAVILAAP